MRTIDVRTTQNVVITYEVASLRDRILAFLLDLIFMAVFIFIVQTVASLTMNYNFISVIMFISVTLLGFYTLLFEVFANGQTLGKMILRIKVISIDGRHLSFYDYLLRWAFRIVDIWFTMGALAAIFSSSTVNGQRIGGMVSNSTVVRLNPKFRIQLKDLLRINTIENHTPKYTAVRNFSEQDMLLVKQTIERYQKYKNEAHKEAVLELVEVMKKNLGITEEPKNKIAFLRGLIRDYIVLTR